jgi:serine/threonine protein phosphatase PrpC
MTARYKALDDSGSAAVVAIVGNGEIFVANAGDSRAILSVEPEPDTLRGVQISEDHKPDRPDEKARIESHGGKIKYHGVWRVNGNLALSRAFGDTTSKSRPFVIATPEVYHRRL